jgi:hypothetical protein
MKNENEKKPAPAVNATKPVIDKAALEASKAVKSDTINNNKTVLK